MAAVKWIFVVLFGVGSAGSLAMAFVGQEPARQPSPRTAPPLALRPFPEMVAMAGVPKAPDVAETPEAVPEEKAPEPVAAAKPPEPEAAAEKPAPVAAKPEPVAAAKPPPAPVARAPEPKPEPAPKAEPVAKAPEPKPEPAEPAAKPEPAPKAEPVAAAPKPEGLLNLRASDTADVYLDGKKLGGSPLLGIKARAGNHKVRFDCYDAAGNTVAGPVQTIAVKADSEVDVEYPCPVE